MLSKSNWETVSKTVSIKVCQLLGTKKKVLSSALMKEINRLKTAKTMTFIKNKFVNEKSKLNNLTENNDIIWNCSNGVSNM